MRCSKLKERSHCVRNFILHCAVLFSAVIDQFWHIRTIWGRLPCFQVELAGTWAGPNTGQKTPVVITFGHQSFCTQVLGSTFVASNKVNLPRLHINSREIYCTPAPSCREGGLSLLPNFQIGGGGAWQGLNFWRGVARKVVDTFFRGGGAVFT